MKRYSHIFRSRPIARALPEWEIDEQIFAEPEKSTEGSNPRALAKPSRWFDPVLNREQKPSTGRPGAVLRNVGVERKVQEHMKLSHRWY
ncbi:MAG: hypothetical protein LAP85_28525 [Acidobacteriia bacterium]|nr:hypothetical protein [Terriglobia bacterium]